MNKVILIGNLTKDPEVTTTSNGISLCRFTLAVQRRFVNSEGDREADFISIVVWRNQAENCGKFLKKGSKCAVVGNIQTRNYDAQDGTKRYVTEVVAEEVEFLGSRPASDDEGRQASNFEKSEKTEEKSQMMPEYEPIDDDTLPF